MKTVQIVFCLDLMDKSDETSKKVIEDIATYKKIVKKPLKLFLVM